MFNLSVFLIRSYVHRINVIINCGYAVLVGIELMIRFQFIIYAHLDYVYIQTFEYINFISN